MFGNNRARSGIVVLPCGAGKTLVGIVAATTLGKSTMVLCNSTVSVEQWFAQFKMWTDIPEDRIHKFTAGSKVLPPWLTHKDERGRHTTAGVIISTYYMISYSQRRAAETAAVMNAIEDREWGLLLLDEVHQVPADRFLTCTTEKTRSRCKLGLTATLVREDGKIDDLNFLIGPKMYEANWLDLQERGFIATVSCAEVWCEMAPCFFDTYLKESTPEALRRLLYVMNPNKFRATQFLMQTHELRGDKTIVFSDDVFALKQYAVALGRAFIYGSTPQGERMELLEKFKIGATLDNGVPCNTLFISKVGDTSIDLPEANVIIQVSSHFAARRQEAQRLGRILRPKKGQRPGDGGFNAYFYTLVSRDTREMYYSTKRQQFLVDQGYAFKVITSLIEEGGGGGDLRYGTHAEQVELLGQTMAKYEEGAHADLNDAEAAEASQADGAGGFGGGGGAGTKRKSGSMSEMSGGAELSYHERPAAHGGGAGHALFRQRERERAKVKAAAKNAAAGAGGSGF